MSGIFNGIGLAPISIGVDVFAISAAAAVHYDGTCHSHGDNACWDDTRPMAVKGFGFVSPDDCARGLDTTFTELRIGIRA